MKKRFLIGPKVFSGPEYMPKGKRLFVIKKLPGCYIVGPKTKRQMKEKLK